MPNQLQRWTQFSHDTPRERAHQAWLIENEPAEEKKARLAREDDERERLRVAEQNVVKGKETIHQRISKEEAEKAGYKLGDKLPIISTERKDIR